MGGFGWVGAAKGANDSLQEMLTRAFAERLEMERMQLARDSSSRADRQLEATLGLQREQSERSRRDQQLQEAAIALGQADAMGQGAELSPEIAGVLKGTPYGARVQSKTTLPSSTVAMPLEASMATPESAGASQRPRQIADLVRRDTGSPTGGGRHPLDIASLVKRDSSVSPLMSSPTSSAGGRGYDVLAPTAAQAREAGLQQSLRELTEDQNLPETVRRYLKLRASGVNIPNPESLETQAERDARGRVARDTDFTDFTRRADYQAQIADTARARARQDAQTVTPRDRRDALRLADNAAADYIDSLKDPDGNMPASIDPQAIRQQFIEEYEAAMHPDAPRPRRPQSGGAGGAVNVRPMRSGRIGEAVTPAGGANASSDPYERYLSRSGGR